MLGDGRAADLKALGELSDRPRSIAKALENRSASAITKRLEDVVCVSHDLP
jgi:hypothetical protein